MRVLIVDDSQFVRRFLHTVLEQKHGSEVVGEACDGLEAVQKVQELQPDLILLDIGLPKLNGLEAAKRINEVAHKSKILFVTMISDAEVVDRALRSGALGYVLKSDVGHELLPAINAVHQGKQFISSGLSR